MASTATFRANPAYALLPTKGLKPADVDALGGSVGDLEVAALLHPQEASGLVVKAIDEATAGLLAQLRTPRTLPPHAQLRPKAVAAMVLDGVLEVDTGDGFVSGPAAMSSMRGFDDVPDASGRLAELSVRALQTAQSSAIVDSGFLAMLLYRYNTAPASPGVLAEVGHDVATYLGLDRPAVRKTLDKHWQRAPDGGADGWLAWQPREPRPPPLFKLYVSPTPDVAKEVIAVVVAAMAAGSPAPFKVGRDVYGLLRPDKLVVYFPSLSELRQAARRMMQTLDGCPVQGVPFTAELAGDGLLSWGTDPPRSAGASQNGDSWRFWLVRRLAAALTTANAGPSAGLEPWRFAMLRVILDDVDPVTWTPADEIWKDEG